jgi:hypothetical protein
MAMNVDPSRRIQHLEPKQRVLIKTGTFRGLQGEVRMFTSSGSDDEPSTEAHVNVKLPLAAMSSWGCRTAPVSFTNPTVDDLEIL